MKKTVRDSEVTITELMIPSYANFGGKVHGGILLGLMDKVAYVCASKYSGSYCVTVAVEGVEFMSPVEVGELVSLKATVNYVGRTTMIVGIRVESLNPQSGMTKHTNSCYFTMAAKNQDGELCEVPVLCVEDETQLRRYCEGIMIRKMSLQKREYLKANLQGIDLQERLEMTRGERVELTFL
ncbi:MAG: acyl-CoA thioesterase [Flavobacteriales bacterium]|jgi:acyl-CoA hydrolase